MLAFSLCPQGKEDPAKNSGTPGLAESKVEGSWVPKSPLGELLALLEHLFGLYVKNHQVFGDSSWRYLN